MVRAPPESGDCRISKAMSLTTGTSAFSCWLRLRGCGAAGAVGRSAMDFPCKLKNCTDAVVQQYQPVSDPPTWELTAKAVDGERRMVDLLLSVLAILKCFWSIASIACTRKCSAAVWLLCVEVLQGLSFAVKLVDWPQLLLGSTEDVEVHGKGGWGRVVPARGWRA
eukprot:Skav231217  [mRNA]  locus=scaffold2958:240111:244391:- [translate_table: standard]